MAANTTPPKVRLLTPLLLLFMLAMILANIGGNMYGPLEALYLQDLAQYRSDWPVLYHFTNHSPSAANSGRLGFGRSGACERLPMTSCGIFVYVPSSWPRVGVADRLGVRRHNSIADRPV
jgi:hypothetical protein